MSIFALCADPYSSGASRSHGRNNSTMMETTLKVVGAAGAFFFTLGAMVLDPLLIVPAFICAAVALISCVDCDLLSIFSSACVPSASSGRPRHHYTNVPAATPVNVHSYSAPAPSYSARAIPSYPVAPPPGATVYGVSQGAYGAPYFVAPLPPVTAHTARGGGTILTTPAAAPGFQPVLSHQHYAPSSSSAPWGNPPPPASFVQTPFQQQQTTITVDGRPVHMTQHASGALSLTRATSYAQPPLQQQQTERSVAPPPEVRVGRGGASIPMPAATTRMQPLPPPPSNPVAPPPTLHIRRGGGSNDYVTGSQHL